MFDSSVSQHQYLPRNGTNYKKTYFKRDNNFSVLVNCSREFSGALGQTVTVTCRCLVSYQDLTEIVIFLQFTILFLNLISIGWLILKSVTSLCSNFISGLLLDEDGLELYETSSLIKNLQVI